MDARRPCAILARKKGVKRMSVAAMMLATCAWMLNPLKAKMKLVITVC